MDVAWIITLYLWCYSYLHVSGDTYGRPISGQREVCGYSSPSDLNQWKAAEGIFLKPTEAGLESRGIHDELWITLWCDFFNKQSTGHCYFQTNFCQHLWTKFMFTDNFSGSEIWQFFTISLWGICYVVITKTLQKLYVSIEVSDHSQNYQHSNADGFM